MRRVWAPTWRNPFRTRITSPGLERLDRVIAAANRDLEKRGFNVKAITAFHKRHPELFPPLTPEQAKWLDVFKYSNADPFKHPHLKAEYDSLPAPPAPPWTPELRAEYQSYQGTPEQIRAAGPWPKFEEIV